jgi:hypothetical protein
MNRKPIKKKVGQGKRKPRLTDAEFKSQLYKIFDEGITAYMGVRERLRETKSFGNERFDLIYRQSYEEYAKIKEKAEAEALAANAGDAVKIALKAKIERQSKIEKQIAEIEAKLESGKTKDIAFIKGKPTAFDRDLLPTEIANYHKTIISLNAELSKMAGDYAPLRSRIGGDPDSPPLQGDAPTAIDLSKLSTTALLELREQLKPNNAGN